MTTALRIFRSGTHRSNDNRTLTFSEADLAASAAAYDPKLHEAPLVVGHPADNAPAYGWVKGLTSKSGELVAEPGQVDPQFAELVTAGRFKKISASFYTPQSPHNPKPGVYYLRHVGFLGAMPPAVKGLGDAKFSGGDEDVIAFDEQANARLWRNFRDWLLAKFGQDEADRTVPSYVIEQLEADAQQEQQELAPAGYSEDKEQTMKDAQAREAELQEKERALAAKEKAVEARAAEFAEREAKVARADVETFAEKLVKAGRVLPRDKAPLVELLSGVPDGALEFAEGDKRVKVGRREWLRTFLEKLPVQVDYTERAADDGAVVTDDPVELAERAVKYRLEQEKAGNPMRVSEAVRAVQGKR